MKKQIFIYSTLSILLLSLISSCFVRQRPNVIFILADDIGYGDVGCYGAKAISTPNIDSLASHSVIFTNAYAPASTCSPTRYALLTGEYAFRKNVGIMSGDAPLSIDLNMNNLTKAKASKCSFNDSKSAARLFLKADAKTYCSYVITQDNNGDIAMHKGEWKYIPAYKNVPAQLFNLNTDPKETTNLVQEKDLQSLISEFERKA